MECSANPAHNLQIASNASSCRDLTLLTPLGLLDSLLRSRLTSPKKCPLYLNDRRRDISVFEPLLLLLWVVLSNDAIFAKEERVCEPIKAFHYVGPRCNLLPHCLIRNILKQEYYAYHLPKFSKSPIEPILSTTAAELAHVSCKSFACHHWVHESSYGSFF